MNHETSSNEATPHARQRSYQALAGKLQSREAVVGVIGLGYAGFPLVKAFEAASHTFVGIDIDRERVAVAGRGERYMSHLPSDFFTCLTNSDRFVATTDEIAVGNCDVVAICVHAPLGPRREPDLGFVENAGYQLGQGMTQMQLAILESTTCPGPSRREFYDAVVRGMADRSGALLLGLFLAYASEREGPGRSDDSVAIPKHVGGLDADSLASVVDLHESSFETIGPASSPDGTEASKLLENVFRATTIAVINEMRIVLDQLGIDVWEVGEATQFIELAGLINTWMHRLFVDCVAGALNACGKAVSRSRTLVPGLAYKPDVSDTRDSPFFELIAQLRARGSDVFYHDLYISETSAVRGHDLRLTSAELDAVAIRSYDVIVISTAHTVVDHAQNAEHCRLIDDTPTVMADWADEPGERLVKA